MAAEIVPLAITSRTTVSGTVSVRVEFWPDIIVSRTDVSGELIPALQVEGWFEVKTKVKQNGIFGSYPLKMRVNDSFATVTLKELSTRDSTLNLWGLYQLIHQDLAPDGKLHW